MPTDKFDDQALIARLYDAAIDASLWPDTLQIIAEATGGIGGVMLPVEEKQRPQAIVSRGVGELAHDYALTWAPHDTRAARIAARGIGQGIYGDLDIMTVEEIGRDPFFQDFLRKGGVGLCLASIQTPLPGQVVTLSVQRALGKWAFERADIERLERLRPHINRSVAAAAALSSARHDARDFALALDRRAAAVAIVNDAGLVTATNTAMQQLLGGQIDIRKGQLVARDTATTKAIEALIGSCLAANEALSGHPVLVCGEHHRQRLLLQAIPASGRMRERFADTFTRGGGAIIIVHDLDRDQPPSVTKPLVQMGLTPAEARIAELIGSGLSPNEAADHLGVGFETARKHLKQVFAKLNLRRQSQLAILVTKLQMMS